MKKLICVMLLIATPVLARPYHWPAINYGGITCDTVRSYVANYGKAIARHIGRTYGMTAMQEHEAESCLARK